MESLSEMIIKLRKEKHFSQETLAEKIGVSRQAVSKWERNESSPDIQNIELLADVFEVSIDELLGRVISETAQKTNNFKEKRNQVVAAMALLSLIIYLIIGYVWNGWAYWMIPYAMIPLSYVLFNIFYKQK
ncbi:MAG: helix-turn-helix transcriptional regulator [Clostridiales bacterium]|nr:helix-turn-helix transcriptional regulator [Clostridiales bacterium]